MPQGTNRIWYLMVILSHNNLFVPHWHYTLIYGLPVRNVTFLSETKYTWILHFTWPTIYLSTLYDRFEFKILVTIYIIESYLISKIPSMVIWYRFQQDISYRDLFIFHYFRYLNLFPDFMKCYVNVLLYSTCLIIMTILIIWSFLLRGILYLKSIGLLRFPAYHRLCPSRTWHWTLHSSGKWFATLCNWIISWTLSSHIYLTRI